MEDNNSGDEQKGFYVEPKRDCPHITANINLEIYNDQQRLRALVGNGRCEGPSCDHAQENWLCLGCGKRFCSRYVKGHMQKHFDETGHAICASYSDLSIWCYSCESYITDPAFAPLLGMMSNEKFGRTPSRGASGAGDPGTGGRYTAHATATQMEELEDPPEEFQKNVKALAQMIREAKHFIVFTGAGVSTSAGVPDFRGPQGVWTLKATGGRRTEPTTPMLRAKPTLTHMALVALQDAGLLKFLISQNIDGMHRRSGILPSNLAELHGNSNLEVCTKCGKEYLRDFDTSDGSAAGTHATGRLCTVQGCGGGLVDTIIHFEESLPRQLIQKGFSEAEKADVCLCLGSSLTVTPAASMPKTVGKNPQGKLVICNLQRTPLDSFTSLRIHSKIDELMQALMEELGIPIPPFVLKRRLHVSHAGGKVKIAGVDIDGTPVTLLTKVVAMPKSGSPVTKKQQDKATTTFEFDTNGETTMNFELHFHGHYAESPVQITYSMTEASGGRRYLLCFDLEQAKWGWRYEPFDAEQVDQQAPVWPDKIQDPRHEHELKLNSDVYGGGFRCDDCLKPGLGWAYHCGRCSYDLHPYCGHQAARGDRS